MDDSRREAIKTLTLVAAGAAAGSLLSGCAGAADKSKPEAKRVRYGMVIDLKKCVGCQACVVACKAENHTPPGVMYNTVMEGEEGSYPHVSRWFMPRPCMQCARSSCSIVCPTKATYVRDDGVVVIDYERCIGCRYCMAACPYGSRTFDFGHYYNGPDHVKAQAGTMQATTPTAYDRTPSPEYGQHRVRQGFQSPIQNVRKCMFCLHRVKRGLLPACVATCIGRAMYFGDLNDPESEVYRLLHRGDRHHMRLKEELGNEPSVYYLT